MNPISLASSTVLVSAAILLTILIAETKFSNALPSNYISYLPLSLGNLIGVSLANSKRQKAKNFAENTSGVNYCPKLLTARNPENPTPEKTTPLSPVRATTLRFRSRTHRQKHSQMKQLRTPEASSGRVMPKWTIRKITVTTERPEVKRTTKLPRSKNPLCYFTAIACDTKYGP